MLQRIKTAGSHWEIKFKARVPSVLVFFILLFPVSMRKAKREVSKNSACVADTEFESSALPSERFENTQRFQR